MFHGRLASVIRLYRYGSVLYLVREWTSWVINPLDKNRLVATAVSDARANLALETTVTSELVRI